jgi:YvrJ protein family
LASSSQYNRGVAFKDITDFISSVGFPIAVAIYLLWRQDNQHIDNLKAIHELIVAVKALSEETKRRRD